MIQENYMNRLSHTPLFLSLVILYESLSWWWHLIMLSQFTKKEHIDESGDHRSTVCSLVCVTRVRCSVTLMISSIPSVALSMPFLFPYKYKLFLKITFPYFLSLRISLSFCINLIFFLIVYLHQELIYWNVLFY